METVTLTPKALRQRKLFLAIPILALPFVTLIFWALGGGKMEAAVTGKAATKGFNINLPNPNLKDDNPLDKMNYYDQAATEAEKMDELIKKDPNYQTQPSPAELSLQIDKDNKKLTSGKRASENLNTKGYQNPNEAKVYAKLAALQKAINKPTPEVSVADQHSRYTYGKGIEPPSNEVAKMEEMMQMMNQPAMPDPELQQISGMLETIVDIQHPERMQEKLRKASQAQRGQVFAVATKGSENNISLLDTEQTERTERDDILQPKSNGFYSLTENSPEEAEPNAIEAVVHETQTFVNGSTVKLRLTTDVYINGVLIPKDNFLFGTASLKGERLNIKINSLRYEESLFPVDLSVYDMDGLDGIYIPGAIARDVAKSSANSSMQTLGVTTLDDSWGAQAAGAGVEMAKTMFSKKVKLIKVVVKAGYQVLLKDEKQKKN